MIEATHFIDAMMAADLERSQLQAVEDRVAQARACIARRCGSCEHWMKSRSCPAERNVNGYSRGPSAQSRAAMSCGSYQLSRRSKSSAEKVRQDALDMASDYGLAVLVPELID